MSILDSQQKRASMNFGSLASTTGTNPSQNTNRRALVDISNKTASTMNSIQNVAITQKPTIPTMVKPNNSTTVKKETSYTSPVRKNAVDAMIMSPKVDASDADKPESCVEYVKDIFSHYRSIETKYMPNPNYMTFQRNFNEQTRVLTINWLLNVHNHFELSPETMFLCVNIFDRFLSAHPDVALEKIHLVAVTSLFIATKYEEVKPLLTEHVIKITRKMYSKEEILHMERLILKTLDFNLTIASSNVFLKRYLKCSVQFDDVQVFIASFVNEMTLYDMNMLNYTPSTVACAAIYVARSLRKLGEKWNSNLIYYTGKTEEEILPCARQIYYFMKHFCNTLYFEGGRKPDRNFLLYRYGKEDRLRISESIRHVFSQKRKE
ncbi:hypothetical protein FDP41_012990 [Naegleria fowleri]|uniref:Cyclin N-terminal domain-containing protein n=1 Tax=Naegleria fowleri TaxID=5763 RepID=A0A6A5C377_NAEFO|nr:uncharacterized protein FDP41_012990 [Naegleria fowleri]KAF0981202.1 hypothetical protein FDP41_012990 [Naegleria fowleri]CAG4711401.1 unnamed protein product [Naegleria fowleri]